MGATHAHEQLSSFAMTAMEALAPLREAGSWILGGWVSSGVVSVSRARPLWALHEFSPSSREDGSHESWRREPGSGSQGLAPMRCSSGFHLSQDGWCSRTQEPGLPGHCKKSSLRKSARREKLAHFPDDVTPNVGALCSEQNDPF